MSGKKEFILFWNKRRNNTINGFDNNWQLQRVKSNVQLEFSENIYYKLAWHSLQKLFENSRFLVVFANSTVNFKLDCCTCNYYIFMVKSTCQKNSLNYENSRILKRPCLELKIIHVWMTCTGILTLLTLKSKNPIIGTYMIFLLILLIHEKCFLIFCKFGIPTLSLKAIFFLFLHIKLFTSKQVFMLFFSQDYGNASNFLTPWWIKSPEVAVNRTTNEE